MITTKNLQALDPETAKRALIALLRSDNRMCARIEGAVREAERREAQMFSEFQRATREDNPAKREEIIQDIMKLFPGAITREEIEKQMALDAQNECFVNDTYQVSKSDQDGIIWLSIKRRDKEPIHDWRDLQEIKNRLVGPENEAIEIYPAESRRVDTANQYHLWVFKDPAFRLPIGFHAGRLVTSEQGRHDKQRPLEGKISG